MWTALTCLVAAISIIQIILMKTDPSHLNGPRCPYIIYHQSGAGQWSYELSYKIHNQTPIDRLKIYFPKENHLNS